MLAQINWREKNRRWNESESDPIYDDVLSPHNDFGVLRVVVASHREIE